MENFDTKLAARYIGKSASWLNKTRLSGTGPTYLKIGGGVRYLRPDLDDWLASKRRTAVYDFANDNAAAQSARAA
ncbi:AlpA family transcriptional regulator [Bosea sp. (in: a-proteobacteria)]|uniref:helix-turn-helix transcriptional regulator n=1 Tax=Bosea sp. (in: a-proteobacteria) TaxID=1871050 RepID=UPI0027345935|nr:DNA-binding protein [Bosea sp. (in: a-proteobacteria)]MDP3257828.1 DNA-binding protein [Bosea sp. (in: a-proteobacteria)]